MLYSIRGKIIKKEVNKVVVEVFDALALCLHVPERITDEVSIGEVKTFFVEMSVREDGVRLYGFLDEREKEVFRLLVDVQLLGPQKAINILSGIKWQELLKAIANEDLVTLSNIKGVGSKTAKRIIAELKDKLIFEQWVSKEEVEQVSIYEDALSALMALGFNKKDIMKHLEDICTKDKKLTVEEVIKETLARLRNISK